MLANEQEGLFTQWLADHKGLIFKVVRTFAASPEDQADLFQEILVQLWSSIPTFRREASAPTWIYKVALNTALAWQRTEKKHHQRRKPLVEICEVANPSGDPLEARETAEMLDALYGEIRKLRKIDSSLILLYLDGLSYREMAEILGISETNVGVKLNRIKKRLAETMKGAGNEL